MISEDQEQRLLNICSEKIMPYEGFLKIHSELKNLTESQINEALGIIRKCLSMKQVRISEYRLKELIEASNHIQSSEHIEKRKQGTITFLIQRLPGGDAFIYYEAVKPAYLRGGFQ